MERIIGKKRKGRNIENNKAKKRKITSNEILGTLPRHYIKWENVWLEGEKTDMLIGRNIYENDHSKWKKREKPRTKEKIKEEHEEDDNKEEDEDKKETEDFQEATIKEEEEFYKDEVVLDLKNELNEELREVLREEKEIILKRRRFIKNKTKRTSKLILLSVIFLFLFLLLLIRSLKINVQLVKKIDENHRDNIWNAILDEEKHFEMKKKPHLKNQKKMEGINHEECTFPKIRKRSKLIRILLKFFRG